MRDCRQCELKLSASRPAQAQTIEPKDALEMCKQHLNTFTITARSFECFGLGQRSGYVLWARAMYLRWMHQRAEVVAQYGERLWRTFLLLFVAVAAMMDRRSHTATAYRVLLELPADSDGIFRTSKRTAALDLVSGAAVAIRDSLLQLWPAKAKSS